MKIIEAIIKVCTILAFATIVIGVIIPMIFPLPNTDEFNNRYPLVMYGIFFFFGGIIIVLACFVPKSFYKKLDKIDKKNKSYKANVIFNDFNELRLKLILGLKQNGYELFEPKIKCSNNNVYVYYKKHGASVSYYVIMYSDANELKITLNESSEILKKCIDEKSKLRSSTISVSSILCVNRVSSDFYKHLGDTSVTSMREYELRAGYSFGGKTFYIGSSPISFGIDRVKKMQNELLSILEIPKENFKN